MLDYLIAGSVTLADTGTRSVTKVEGLVGLSTIRGDAYDRPEQDGGVEPYNQFQSSKTVSVTGEVWAATVPLCFADFGQLLQGLEAMISTPALLKWRPAGDTRDLQASAKLIGSVQPTLDAENGNSPFLTYQAQFRLADPRGYSQTLQSASTGAPSANGGMPYPIIYPIQYGSGVTGGSIVATNLGNTISWPTFYLIGPCNGPVLSVGASVLTFSSLVLAAGQTLVVQTNPANRSATVAGANVIGSLRFADSVFAGLQPGVGTNVGFYSLSGGTTTDTNLTVAWRDAWTA